MSEKLLHYRGPYGEQINPVSRELIDYEPLKTRSEIYNYEINEHLHSDLIQIFFIMEGGGFLLSEGKKIALHPPCGLIIPNNTLHGFVLQSTIQGDVFTFSNIFFEKCLMESQQVLLKLNLLQQLSFKEKMVESKEIYYLKNRLIEELAAYRSEKKRVIPLLFQLLLFHLYRVEQQQSSQIIPTDNRMLNYFHDFQNHIKQTIYETKSIKYYAKLINITPVHLNRICQSLVQKSALQVVHEYLLNETKKYLLGTSNSIAEISYLFGFKDPSHFSKFFRRMEGVSPRIFRQTH